MLIGIVAVVAIVGIIVMLSGTADTDGVTKLSVGENMEEKALGPGNRFRAISLFVLVAVMTLASGTLSISASYTV